MANTTLTQTGAEVQAAIDKAEKLPTVTGSDEGKTLQVDSSGNFVANMVSGGTQLYKHVIPDAIASGVDLVVVSTDSSRYQTCEALCISLRAGHILNMYQQTFMTFKFLIFEDDYDDDFELTYCDIDKIENPNINVHKISYSTSFSSYTPTAL